MDIVLSQKSDKPIYTQVYEQISSQIMSGELKAGEKLLPIRTVALNLRVSVIPIKQAWEQLEKDGFICTSAGRGTFVNKIGQTELSGKRLSAAKELLERDIASCYEMGVSAKEILTIVQEILMS